MHRLALLSVAGGIAMAGLIWSTASADACNPSRSNDGTYYYDGWSHPLSSGYVGGVYSTLDTRNPYVCCSSYNEYKVRLEQSPNFESYGWEDTGSGPYGRYYWPCTSGNTECSALDSLGYTVNSSYTFTVLWDPNTDTATFQRNGQYVDSRTTAGWFYPPKGTISGAIGTLAVQMPGSVTNPAQSNNPYIYINSWQPFSTGWVDRSTTNNSLYFGNNTVWDTRGNQVGGSIWDKSCYS